MSNKSQLQTNNTNLDALISRVNAAKNTAASLPEAGGGGVPTTYTLHGSYLLKKEAVYDGSNFTEPLELTFVNESGYVDDSVSAYYREGVNMMSSAGVDRITLNSERFEIHMPHAGVTLPDGIAYIDTSGWYRNDFPSECYRIIEFCRPTTVPKAFYDVFSGLLDTSINISPHSIGVITGKHEIIQDCYENYELDLNKSIYLMNNTSAEIMINGKTLFPYETKEARGMSPMVIQLLVAPIDYDFAEIFVYYVPGGFDDLGYDRAQLLEPFLYVKDEVYGIYSGFFSVESPTDQNLLVFSEEPIPELEQ